MKIKMTIDDIMKVINTRTSEAINRMYEEKASWRKDFDFEACERSGHDPAIVFDGIVDSDDEWNYFIEAMSNYIKNKEYGFTLLIKHLRKFGFKVSRTGNVISMF